MRLANGSIILLLTLVLGCSADDKCIADCASGTETSGDTEPAVDSGSGSGSGGTPACASAEAEATAWVQANRACTYISDCVQLDAICYQGPETGTCGTVAVSRDADPATWETLHDALQSCECGANACGESVACSDEGQCEGIGPVGDICPAVDADIAAFLAANRACTGDEDCVGVAADCYEGPEKACTEIALNTAADLETWDRLHGLLETCVDGCGGSACGASFSCGPEGLCVATFP